MLSTLPHTMIFLLIPAIAVFAGGFLSLIRTPSSKSISVIQHFTAGLVLAAVAVELVADLSEHHNTLALIFGFSCGVALMLGVQWWANKSQENQGARREDPKGLIATVGIDMFIDGFLVGVSFAIGFKQGVIITIALSTEIFFLTLSSSAALAKKAVARKKIIFITAVFALLLVGGITLGHMISSYVTGNILVIVLAFATAALLYLVVEELLVEAHEEPESPLATVMFFVGFLTLFLLDSY